MKRILAALSLLLSVSTMAATLSPIQLLNPAGSTSGQVIASTGATTAPAWTTVTLSGLGGLAKASNLSDVASVSTSRTNLGLGTAAVANTGTSGATVPLLSTANTWTLAQTFTVRPTFNGNTPYDTGNLSTSAQLAAAISDETGTGSVVFSTAPTLNQPNIVGVTNGSSAAAGSVGQIISSTVSLVSLANATPTNVTSVSLTAGQWSCSGAIEFIPATSTITSAMLGSLSTVSATMGGVGARFELLVPFTTGAPVQSFPTPVVPINVSTTTTLFAVAQANFTTSTQTSNASISCLRVR